MSGSNEGSSYPEGNFGGNQLLDGSIRLLPLYLSQTNDLHGRLAMQPIRGSHHQLPCVLRVYSPIDSHTCQTPLSLFQDDQMGSPQADARSTNVPRHAMRHALLSTIATITSPRAFQQSGLGPPLQSVSFNVPSRSTDRLTMFQIDRDIFLGRNLPLDWGCIPKQLDLLTTPHGATGSGHNGALTLSGAPFQGT
ncbi:hypothetical protein VNO80_25231 [Phaseolus coccineus]|uniref:Uncharacterized protein n=1 Tax=Phaseolus coccineus TaxID=3886 RepID=A0AAN9LUD4_PHACN